MPDDTTPADDLAAHLARIHGEMDRLIDMIEEQTAKYRGRPLTEDEIVAARSLGTTYQRLAEIMLRAARDVEANLGIITADKRN